MIRSRRSMRLWIRLAFFVAAVVMLWPLPFSHTIAEIPVQASPFITLCSILAAGTFNAGLIAGLLFALIGVVRKRWFCRYACPTGLIQDGCVRVGLRLTSWWKRIHPIGNYILFITVAGAVVGYPILLWMDPMAIFSSALSVRTSENLAAGLAAAAGLALLCVIALIFGDMWCARICPLGALQNLLSKAGIFILPGENRERTDQRDNSPAEARPFAATRRTFLTVVAGIGLGLWEKRIGSARGTQAPLRPPGAAGEDVFSGICVRCGNCIRTCPSGIIHADTGDAGVSGLLAPVVRYRDKYCLEDCRECTGVCPSGALQALSLQGKQRYKIGEALVDGRLCFLVQGVNDCDVCVRSCPFDAVEIYWDEELYVAYPNIDRDKCNGCGACEAYCPTPNTKAIRVWKLE